ncbi:uncharacterized protein V1510DRAFT_414364 [Dipodascopsis tothii]|uniref:uncharacterized protein n=1 Tax=Dipodascopsis tothii TaxID=44089 RepID=UPI0034CF2358
MGAEALVGPGAKRQEMSLRDQRVCKSFLVGICPHDLFTNTKQDLGTCPKVHSDSLRAEYKREKERGRDFAEFEYEYLKDLEKYIFDCNRRIEAAQRRLDKTPDEVEKSKELMRQIEEFSESIDDSLVEIGVLGDMGLVEQALQEYHQVKIKRYDRAQRERDLRLMADTSGASGHQKLQVCDVCSAYLSRLDNDRRLADHFAGKMHLGYAQMRTLYKDLQDRVAARKAKGDRAPDRGDRRSRDRRRRRDRDYY